MIGLAPDETGGDPVALHRPEPAGDVILMTGGFNDRQDICPEFGCIAWVMERDGAALHSWQYAPFALFDRDNHAGIDTAKGTPILKLDTATGAPVWSYRSVSGLAPFCAAEGKRHDGPPLPGCTPWAPISAAAPTSAA